MKLYHGSNMRVCKPDLCHSKPYKDFGQGFYLSSDRQQAKELAVTKVAQMKTGEPIIEFLFDESIMASDELRVRIFEDYCEEWAEFVLTNRDNTITQPSHDYDIVYGPIADDGVNFQLRRYRGGVISLSRLIEELKFAKGITFQYYFGTERALQKLTAL